MIGMNRDTGKPLGDLEHLAQSIGDILSTPIGTRTMLREYGSALLELLDQPMNALGRLRLYAAVADALSRWEPRLTLKRVAIAPGSAEAMSAGAFALELHGAVQGASASDIVQLTIPLRIATV